MTRLIELIRRPRLGFTKLLRRYCMHRPKTRAWVRTRARKWCVDEELPVPTRRGFLMKVSPRDYISYGIYFYGDYDRPMSEFIRHHLPAGGVALDIGAERGWFSLLMAKLVGRQGQVHAFEAFPLTAQRLQANAALNQFDQITCHPVALSNRSGEIHFHPPSDVITGGASFLEHCGGVGYVSDSGGEGTITVPCQTLEATFADHPIDRLDLIKIDIEGAEVDALKSGEALIGRFKPVIVIEYNRACLERAGTDWQTLDDLFESWGYDRYLLKNGLIPLNLEDWQDVADEEAVLNVYCLPRRT